MAANTPSATPPAGFPTGCKKALPAGLPRDRRLTRSALFLETYEAGLCIRGRLMTLWVRRQPDAALRMGVVASRKVGGAVQRNRAKRLLREAWRLNGYRFAPGVDVILSARSSILQMKRADVEKELLYLGGKARLLERTVKS